MFCHLLLLLAASVISFEVAVALWSWKNQDLSRVILIFSFVVAVLKIMQALSRLSSYFML